MKRISLSIIGCLSLGLLSCGDLFNETEALTVGTSEHATQFERSFPTNSLNDDLLEAVRESDSERIASLLDRGANVNHRDENGFTILVNALAHYELEFVDELLSQGAVTDSSILLDERNTEPTPTELNVDIKLLDAVAEGKWILARELIDQGADINAIDDEGFTVLATTLASLELSVIDLLLSHGARV